MDLVERHAGSIAKKIGWEVSFILVSVLHLLVSR